MQITNNGAPYSLVRLEGVSCIVGECPGHIKEGDGMVCSGSVLV